MKASLISALIVGLISGFIGFASVGRDGDSAATIDKVEKHLQGGFQVTETKPTPGAGGYFFDLIITPEWKEYTKLGDSLTSLNRSIFIAKALVKYGEVSNEAPQGVLFNEWNGRYEKASNHWHIQEDSASIAKTTILAAIGGAIAGGLVVWLLCHGWPFLLARVRELSGAIRGK